MPEKEIKISELAQIYKEHYHAAYNVLQPHEQDVIKKYQTPDIKLSKSNELFALNFIKNIIEKAENQYFAVEKPKIQIKEIPNNQIVGGDNEELLSNSKK